MFFLGFFNWLLTNQMPYSKFKGPFLYRRSQGFVDYILKYIKVYTVSKKSNNDYVGRRYQNE